MAAVKIQPDDAKLALRRMLGVERLRKAAQAFLDEETEIARDSFGQPGLPFTDRMWRQSDAKGASLAMELRRALKELGSVMPK